MDDQELEKALADAILKVIKDEDDFYNAHKELYVVNEKQHAIYLNAIEAARQIAEGCSGEVFVQPLEPRYLNGHINIKIPGGMSLNKEEIGTLNTFLQHINFIVISPEGNGAVMINAMVSGVFDKKPLLRML